jgi:hypothetical protein
MRKGVILKMIEPLKGGTTRPWVALVDDGSQTQGLSIVKFFRQQDLEQANYLASEIMGSVLCQEFDIRTPGFCLADMHPDAIEYSPESFKARMNEAPYPQPWFSSRSMMPCAEYSSLLGTSDLDREEAVRIICFDALILNTDRVIQKPNLLFDNGRLIAIDHERAFAIHEPRPSDQARIIHDHVLLKPAKAWFRKNPDDLTDTFEEYLRNLNLTEWEAALDTLAEMGRPFLHRDNWRNYLTECKRNPSLLTNRLISLLK